MVLKENILDNLARCEEFPRTLQAGPLSMGY